jgi:hypothetical protein
MKRYYLVKAEIRDGEFEYLQRGTLVRDIPLGKDITIKALEKFCQEWWGYEGSYQIVSYKGHQELPEKDYNVLLKYGI